MKSNPAVGSAATDATASEGPHGLAVRQPLSRERIVAATIAFVDRHCLDDLSMRRLGAELGVEAMSIYRYFPSKSELLDSVLCQVLAPLEPHATGATDWERSVRGYARTFRQVARDHPRLFPLLVTTGPTNSVMSTTIGKMHAMWRAAGVDEATAERAQCTVQGFVTGTSLWEVSRSDDGPPPGDGTADDASFEFGLDVLVAGLRARLGGAGAPRG